MHLHPYLFFTGDAAEALAWYQTIFGGELDTMPHPEKPDMLMHGHLHGGLIEFMGSDSDRTNPYETSRITMGLFGSDASVITEAFNKLAEGGEVTSPIQTESWGDSFGMVTDKFGIDWMVNISAE